ncbi:MAG: glucokinase [Pseudaminobacter sp.]
MTMNPRKALVADIGGTNSRFAIADVDALTIEHFATFPSSLFSSLQAVVERYMASIPHHPILACFAVAASVSTETMRMTNLPWTFTRDELRSACGARHLHLVNDFEALALALPWLTPHDLHGIGGGNLAGRGTKVVLGPGTGLGVAGLAEAASGWIALPGEGGHISFAVRNADELSILDRISEGAAHVSAERMISGPGLTALYRALAEMKGKAVEERAAAGITKAALVHEDPIAEEALELFVGWLGRFAGDMALAFGARGGVYLGGGIAPRIIEALETGSFRAAFEAKGRLSSFLKTVPVHVIKAADAGLRGAAIALSEAVPAVASGHG